MRSAHRRSILGFDPCFCATELKLQRLNFTTRERRRADCDEELRLNRRFSTDVYLGVVETKERDSQFHAGGASGYGEPAVWMRRLSEAGMLPNLARTRGPIVTSVTV